jgi:rfaE bifunctional protein nucleotidyltransferase chain/domain
MTAADKVLARDEVVARRERLREQGKTVALANGLFDILHVGHLSYLESAAALADVLIVAVNSDRSARELKGPSRPVTPDRERARLVAGFACVDCVTVFDERTVEGLLAELRPDLHCKGTDYTPDTVPESAVAAALGIRVVIVGEPKAHSTREIIRRLRSD